jgi:hypothetical protein
MIIRQNNPYVPCVAAAGTQSPVTKHNPYASVVVAAATHSPSVGPRDDYSPCPSPAAIPSGTLHDCLLNDVNFVAWPREAPPRSGAPPKECLVRIFGGQLPYDAPVDQIEWIVHEATGCPVFHTEIIHRWTGGHEPKGCVHTYCFPEHAGTITAFSKRVLVDDTGLWIAADDEQVRALHQYCALLKSDKRRRCANRPYQPVVLEEAKSSFRPRAEPAAAAPAPPAYVTPPPYNGSTTPTTTNISGYHMHQSAPPSYEDLFALTVVYE